MPTAVIFKENLLPPSETFILAQMNALQAFKPRLVGLERAAISLPLHQSPVLLSRHSGSYADLRAKIYRRMPVAPRFHRAIKALRPQLVHAHFASGGKTILPLTQTLGLPLVVTLHGGSDVPTAGRDVGVFRKLAAEAKLFLCVSEFIRQKAIQAGYPADKLQLHYIGIDRSKFYRPKVEANNQEILFVGRLVEMKGCDYLLKAMARVQRNQPEARLSIIGDGPCRTALEVAASQMKINCVFLGVCTNQVVSSYMQNARILCLPSVSTETGDTEGLPTVLAEAQAMGLPVVSTMHAGIPEIVKHNVTGILVPERDVEALTHAISRLLVEESLWKQMAEAASENVKLHFDLNTQTAGLEDIYRMVSSNLS